MGTAAQIKTRREKLGLELKTVAATLAMNEPSYWDLEGHDEELSEAVEIGQAIQLSRILGIKLLPLLEEEFDYAKSGRLSFQNLRELILQNIAAGKVKKDDLSWDIDEFLEEPKIAFEYPITFLKLLSPEIGFDWREVLAKCEEAYQSGQPTQADGPRG